MLQNKSSRPCGGPERGQFLAFSPFGPLEVKGGLATRKGVNFHRDRQITLNSVKSKGEIDRDKPYIRFTSNSERVTGAVGDVKTDLKAEAYDKVGGTTIGEVTASGFFYIDDDGRLSSPYRGITPQPAKATNIRNKSVNVGGCGGSSIVDYKKMPSLKVNGQPANGTMSIR